MNPTQPLHLDGASRIHFIVGDPIAQVKSPSGVSQAFQDAGLNAVCIPAHVAPADLARWTAGVSLSKNVDGIIVTVPHKFAYFDLCATTSDRGAFLKSINTLRRNPDGSWHGDMFDGLGYVKALALKGCSLQGQKALLVGAGGAGSAIAYSLVTGGVRELAIHDEDTARRDALVQRLAALGQCTVVAGSSDPTGFDIAINATPIGMKAGDPHPIESAKFTPAMFVGCVITAPAVTPMVAAAQALGCGTLTGTEMFAQVKDLMVDFLLGA
ncbi:shikimate dehydrogenase [Limnohabitans sp. G3-2]|uniref:shikimate dehydrogenase family protein n=1 Tax=Limnohabitans sp. G3-2 TaxID=1100711 RepID=UPI000C1ECCE0|nr:ThiF family adenylyltransferase [Limnohabitans sp. G3-2]PIT73176.1 shikimate dehydrogenase [Limnohabitans sp. G3-2]